MIHVSSCPCGNPTPHIKLLTDDGRSTQGIFSVFAAKKTIDKLVQQGELTAKEAERLKKNLAGHNLPETNPPLTEELCEEFAQDMALLQDEKVNEIIGELVEEQRLSEEMVNRVRTRIQAIRSTPLTEEEVFDLTEMAGLEFNEEEADKFIDLLAAQKRITAEQVEKMKRESKETRGSNSLFQLFGGAIQVIRL